MTAPQGTTGVSPSRFSYLWFGAALLLVATAAMATLVQGFQQTPDDAGLRGILPAVVPVGLTDEDFGVLGGNWEQWSEETARLLEDFYTKEGLDVAGQRALLAQLKSRLDVMQRALEDPAYQSIYQPLASLQGRLERRVAVAEAVLDTLQVDPRTVQARQQETAFNVLRSLDALQAWLSSVPNGSAWLPYVRADEIRRVLTSQAGPQQAVPLLQEVRSRLQIDQSLAEPQARFLSRPAFVDLHTAVASYLAVARADSPESHQQLRQALAQLAEAIEAYEEDRGAEPAAALRAAYDRVRLTAPDGGVRITTALQDTYLNYNFRLVLSEGFVNRLLADSRQQQGPVRDCILGARVSGYQWTTTNVNVDVQPSPNTARLALAVTGVTQSNTVGVTDQATVSTAGYHTFYATKEIQFDGVNFFSQPAQIAVNANNTTTGIRTRYDRIPIIRRIAGRRAAQEVAAREPQAEAIARSRVADRVLPELNSSVDSEFSRATQRLDRELYQGLRDTGLYPDVMRYSSTDNSVRISTRLMAPGELGGSTPQRVFVPPVGATALIHESLLNNAADRLGFAGREMPDEQVRTELQNFLSRALNRQVDLFSDRPQPEDDEGPNVYLFAPSDPIRFEIADGTVYLTLRTGFRQEGRDEDLPLHAVTVPLTPVVYSDRIVLQRGTVRVAPLEQIGSAAQRIAQAGIIRRKIESALPERTIEPYYNIQAENRVIPVRISRIEALNGWLRVSVE